jgi:hypothetical protein
MAPEKRKILEGPYKVDRVIGIRRTPRGQEAVVRWEDYGVLGDTSEPREHVQPPSKVAKFLAGLPITIDLQWHVDKLRRACRTRLTSRKISERGACHLSRVECASCDHPQVQRAVIDFFRKLSKPATPLKDAGGGKVYFETSDLEHISDIVGLHLSDAQVGTGNLRIKCGSTSYEEMGMVTGVKMVAGGAEFQLLLTIVTFNGKYGTPTFPKMEKKDVYNTEERNIIVDHAKLVLKQIWTTDPIRHHLRAARWTHLPSHVHKLTVAQAGLA